MPGEELDTKETNSRERNLKRDHKAGLKKQDKESKCVHPLNFGGCLMMNDLFPCQLFLSNDKCSPSTPPAPIVHTFCEGPYVFV